MNDHNIETDKLIEESLMKFFYCYPSSYFNTPFKLFFALEQAHWYCLDFYKWNITFEEFVKCFSKYFTIPSIDFMAYKLRIPVYGGIITNPELSHILLVKGYSKFSKYIFPKGKLDFNESSKNCCLRELLEEIGFDATNYITDDFIKPPMERYTLYWIPNVPLSTQFNTQTRQEISSIKWVSFDEILEEQSTKSKLYQANRVLKKIWWFIEEKRKFAFKLDYDKILETFNTET
ncbi:m7GpppN-mRNA hydrolase [Cucumispora dikerogammari]|nr:m7GpppN-mRNA hydrolase [Cucumispora dikerogammari]